jgi:hypothetical protein
VCASVPTQSVDSPARGYLLALAVLGNPASTPGARPSTERPEALAIPSDPGSRRSLECSHLHIERGAHRD